MDKDFNLFKKSLINHDVKLFKKIQKSDLHVHGLLGSSRSVFRKELHNSKLSDFQYTAGIQSISDFIKDNLLHISTTKAGQLKMHECTILSAIKEGISNIEMSVDYRLVINFYNYKTRDFVNDLKLLKEKYSKKINIFYDLGISRNAYIKIHQDLINELLNSRCFDSIDIYGDELSKPINQFKKIYKHAKKLNIKRKCHVGEFGTAKDIYKAVKLLKLNVIQHGISIIDNSKSLQYMKKKKIQFNVCPTSNICLRRVTDIKNHPIRKMYDHGLKVTINTDDQLVFNNSLFKEYCLLYDNNIFSINELNEIRLNSL